MTTVRGTAAGAKAWRRETKALRKMRKLKAVGAWMGCGGAHAQEGQQNPMSEGHGLDPAGEEGQLTGREATPDLCFNNITLACIFL